VDSEEVGPEQRAEGACVAEQAAQDAAKSETQDEEIDSVGQPAGACLAESKPEDSEEVVPEQREERVCVAEQAAQEAAKSETQDVDMDSVGQPADVSLAESKPEDSAEVGPEQRAEGDCFAEQLAESANKPDLHGDGSGMAGVGEKVFEQHEAAVALNGDVSPCSTTIEGAGESEAESTTVDLACAEVDPLSSDSRADEDTAMQEAKASGPRAVQEEHIEEEKTARAAADILADAAAGTDTCSTFQSGEDAVSADQEHIAAAESSVIQAPGGRDNEVRSRFFLSLCCRKRLRQDIDVMNLDESAVKRRRL